MSPHIRECGGWRERRREAARHTNHLPPKRAPALAAFRVRLDTVFPAFLGTSVDYKEVGWHLLSDFHPTSTLHLSRFTVPYHVTDLPMMRERGAAMGMRARSLGLSLFFFGKSRKIGE